MSIIEMSKEFGMSRTTIKKGIDELLDKGILSKNTGEFKSAPYRYRWVLPEFQAPLPSPPDFRSSVDLKGIIETLIFLSPSPIPFSQLVSLSGEEDKNIKTAIIALMGDYQNRAVTLIQTAEGFSFVTDPKYASFASKIITKKRDTLTDAELEVLAVIAYKGPLSRDEIAKIRMKNVQSITTIAALIDKGFIEEIRGDNEVAPKYRITNKFLGHLGYRDVSELPPIAYTHDEILDV